MYFSDFMSNIKVVGQNNLIVELLRQKWCRIIMSFIKNLFLDPKRAELDQNSDVRHVRTLSWLHKLRNTQRKIHGTYLGNIYGIYQECIRSIHRYLWEKIIRNTDPMGRPPKAAPVCLMDIFMDIYGYIINIYGYICYTFLIYSIYIS